VTAFVALLRAVNLGGASTLAMADLKRLCEEAGFEQVKTYIASGNVVFETSLAETMVKADLERRLEKRAGKAIPVMIRTAAEMAEVQQRNPFAQHPGNRVMAFFFDEAPPRNAAEVEGSDGEQVALGRRELYVFYPNGMGRSKLKLKAAREGTARNMNTVARLTEMATTLG
jgi:uncharacterized protein (DUF1697 family)